MVVTEHPSKIRILHSVGHLLRGGIETWLLTIITHLDPERFEHHVMVRTAEDEAFTPAFRDAGAKVLVCTGVKNPFAYALNFRRLVVENGPYDVLHVHGSNPNGLYALLLAKSFGLRRSIVHSHNDVRPLLETRGHLYRLYVAGTLAIYRFLADRGLAASSLAAESMFGLRWRNDQRWRILFYAIDFERFRRAPDPMCRSSLGIPDSAFVVGNVGRLHEQKNHSFLIKVAAEIARRREDFRLLLIGDGPLSSEVFQSIADCKLTDKVVHIRDTTEVARYMCNAMDCFIFPSRYEGLGIVAAEAQAAGLPVVMSDRVPLEAIVIDELVKVLSLSDSPEVWAKAALHLEPRRDPCSTVHAEIFARSRFSLAQSVEQLSEIYHQKAST